MTATNTIARAPKSDVVTDANGFASFTGRDKATRTEALLGVAPLAFAESVSRVDLIRTVGAALGKKPSDAALNAARTEFVIGRVAARLPASEFPKANLSPADKLAHVRNVVCFYAMPLKDGVKARPLTAKHKGRRSPAQHKAIMAATEAWSQVKAELNLGAAQTQAQRNAQKKRGARPEGNAKVQAAAAATPELSAAAQLLKADMTQAEVVSHVVTQAAALLSFANKHAKKLPADFGSAIRAFSAATNKADALFKSVNA